LPRWAKAKIEGYHKAVREQLNDALIWVLLLDGKWLTGKEVPEGRWSDINDGDGMFVYKEFFERGELRQYSSSRKDIWYDPQTFEVWEGA